MTDREERIRRQEALLAVYEEAKAQLMAYPGVVGVGVGLKERGTTLTQEFCFRVYVVEKVPLAQLAPTQAEPPFALTQALVLGLFVWLGWAALRGFRVAR